MLNLNELEATVPSIFAPAAHQSRSDRYAYIPTVQVLEPLLNEGWQITKASQSITRIGDRNYAKHMIRLRQAGISPVLGDTFPETVLINSHDGSSVFKMMLGFFRLVCSNGLVVADSLVQSINIRHTGKVIDEVLQASQQIASETPKITAQIGEWSGIDLNPNEQLAFANSALAIRFPDAPPIDAARLLLPHRSEDNKSDLWHTFNRVQENSLNGGQRGRNSNGRRIRTRQIKGIDQNVNLNRALWMLTEKMAELKKA